MAQLNKRELNEAFRSELKALKPDVEEKQKAGFERMAAANLSTGIPVVDDLTDNFCEAWPRVEGYLSMAIKFGGWIPGMGNVVTMARAAIRVISTKIVPAICSSSE